MAKKLDFANLKEQFKKFMIAKGERVGLILCGGLAVLLVGLGIWNGLTSSRPAGGETSQKLLQAKAKDVEVKIQTAKLEPAVEKSWQDTDRNVRRDGWQDVLPRFVCGPWIGLFE